MADLNHLKPKLSETDGWVAKFYALVDKVGEALSLAQSLDVFVRSHFGDYEPDPANDIVGELLAATRRISVADTYNDSDAGGSAGSKDIHDTILLADDKSFWLPEEKLTSGQAKNIRLLFVADTAASGNVGIKIEAFIGQQLDVGVNTKFSETADEPDYFDTYDDQAISGATNAFGVTATIPATAITTTGLTARIKVTRFAATNSNLADGIHFIGGVRL